LGFKPKKVIQSQHTHKKRALQPNNLIKSIQYRWLNGKSSDSGLIGQTRESDGIINYINKKKFKVKYFFLFMPSLSKRLKKYEVGTKLIL